MSQIIILPGVPTNLLRASDPCDDCGAPMEAHFDVSGCVLMGCPQTARSIRHAIDMANRERAAMREAGIVIDNMPYPEDRQ